MIGKLLPLVLLLACAASLAQLARQPSVVMAPVSNVQLRPGNTTEVPLDFRVATDFHINSHKPKSELLIPTVLKLEPSAPITAAEVKYPAGEETSFTFAPNEKLSVYSGDFTITARLKAAAGAAPGSYPVQGSLRFQACDQKACYPPRTIPVQFQVRVVK